MDLYQILGFDASKRLTITTKEIHKRFRLLSLTEHPDKRQQKQPDRAKTDWKKWQEEFQQIQSAYSTLSDDSKRREYDDQLIVTTTTTTDTRQEKEDAQLQEYLQFAKRLNQDDTDYTKDRKDFGKIIFDEWKEYADTYKDPNEDNAGDYYTNDFEKDDDDGYRDIGDNHIDEAFGEDEKGCLGGSSGNGFGIASNGNLLRASEEQKRLLVKALAMVDAEHHTGQLTSAEYEQRKQALMFCNNTDNNRLLEWIEGRITYNEWAKLALLPTSNPSSKLQLTSSSSS